MEHTIDLIAGDSIYLLVPQASMFSIIVETRPAVATQPIVIPSPVEGNFIDLTASLLHNANPTAPKAWWIRTLDQITGITIHHTGARSAEAVARYHISRGRPSIEYHVFVGFEGQVFQCLDPTYGCWHDHTGHKNRNLAIALAGYHHETPPQVAQLKGLVRATAWAMREYDISIENVAGHDDRAMLAGVDTACPGWDTARWRNDFYTQLRIAL